jgi:hypothetical protein
MTQAMLTTMANDDHFRRGKPANPRPRTTAHCLRMRTLNVPQEHP